MENNIFQTIRETIDKEQFRDYVSSKYGIEFKGRTANGFCPFHDHDHDTPSLGIANGKSGGAFFHCFACGASGDIVRFTEMKESIPPLDAAAAVCEYFGIPHNIKKGELSEEQKAQIEARAKLLQEQNEARAKADAAKRAAAEKRMRARIASIAPELVSNFEAMRPTLIENGLRGIFVNYEAPTFLTYSKDAIGYSHEHQSIAIIIRDERGVPLNIKYREKFAWDSKARAVSSERMSGKWIGESGAAAAPFPIRYFLDNPDDRVIICEGEKDALNLMSFNVNALTLGGAGSRWDEYLELLRGKDVYIWFDHDEAGYENAIKRYYEIKPVARSTHIVLFYMLEKDLNKKYDISDWLYNHTSKITNDNMFDLLAFSCFEPTNIVIDEICDYFPNLREKLAPFRRGKIVHYFDEIFDEFLLTDKNGNCVNIFTVRGELDEPYINTILKNAKALKKSDSDTYERIKKAFFDGALIGEIAQKDWDKYSATFDKLLQINKTVLTNYHQTHIVDMVESFLASVEKLGYPFAQYKGELYFWTKTHYARVDLRVLNHFLQEYWMPRACVDVKKKSVDNSTKIIENLLNKAHPLDTLKRDEQRRVINLTNGTIFISKYGNITFKSRHEKGDGALNILDFAYDKNAACPKWNRFLRQILADKDDIKTLMEFIGYCFLPSHEFESFLFLYGKSGANGKSVILDTIRNFFGEDNVSSLQLQQFEGHQLYGLSNKLINIGTEIDKNGTDKGQLANLKALVSTKDSIMINPKNEKPFNLLPNEKPKLAFSGNAKPKQGVDNATLRRMVLISFDKEIKDGQKIRGLSDRFNDEMAGIFNLALSGLMRLVKQGKFTRSKRMLSELEEYRDDVNPMRAFVRDAVIPDENYFVPNKYLYILYKTYIEDKGGTPQKEKNFYANFIDECTINNIKVTRGRRRMPYPLAGLSGDRPHCVFGIRANENLDFNKINVDGSFIEIGALSEYQIGGARSDEE